MSLQLSYMEIDSLVESFHENLLDAMNQSTRPTYWTTCTFPALSPPTSRPSTTCSLTTVPLT